MIHRSEVVTLSVLICGLTIGTQYLLLSALATNSIGQYALIVCACLGVSLALLLGFLGYGQLRVSTSLILCAALIFFLGKVGNPQLSAVVGIAILLVGLRQGIYQKWFSRLKSVGISLGILLVASLFAVASIDPRFFPVDQPFLFATSFWKDGDPDFTRDAVIATVYHYHGEISTGLHGTAPAKFYLIGPIFFDLVARLSGMSIDEVLLLIHPFVVLPILNLTVVVISALLVPCRDLGQVISRWLLLFAVQFGIGNLTPGFLFNKGIAFELTNNNLIGLLVFFFFLVSLVEGRKSWWLSGVFIVALAFAKAPLVVPASALAVGVSLYRFLIQKQIPISDFLISIAGALSFTYFVKFWNATPVEVVPYYLSKDYLGVDQQYPTILGMPFEFLHARYTVVFAERFQELLGSGWRLDSALVTFASVVILLFGVYWKVVLAFALPSKEVPKVSRFRWAIGSCIIFGFPFLSVTFISGAHDYLAGGAAIASLPLLILYWDSLGALKKPGRLFWRSLILTVTLGSVIFYWMPVARQNLNAIIRVDELSHQPSDLSKVEEPFRFLRPLAERVDKTTHLIYIPKTEDFWRNCIPMNLVKVTLVSRHASLFGVGRCGPFDQDYFYSWGNHGFHSYDSELFRRASLPHSDKELCGEASRLGYKKIFVLRSGTMEELVCAN